MKLRKIQLVLGIALISVSCTAQVDNWQEKSKIPKDEQVVKSDTEWQKSLDPDVYYVMREKGTERPFTGEYVNNKAKGTYQCAACKLPLFSSETKFKSGTGWPSFFKPYNKTNVGELSDNTLGMRRTEVVCNRCGGHLGHVFVDGPEPTGLRYCINSVSLVFSPE